MDSKLLVGLIKEVVKNEVKQQVKEEISKLVKSGIITFNKTRKSQPVTETKVKQVVKVRPTHNQPKNTVEYTKNPLLNEVLNMTTPFSTSERVEGGTPVNSVLDMIQPATYEEDGWETMDYRTAAIPTATPNIETTGNAALDAVTKALNRNYSDLVNHPKFKK